MKNCQYTNVSFWYIPRSLRMKPENESWWSDVYEIVPKMKEIMIRDGNIMINYAPLPSKNLGNFFRMTLTCFPAATEATIDNLLDEIEKIGEKSENH